MNPSVIEIKLLRGKHYYLKFNLLEKNAERQYFYLSGDLETGLQEGKNQRP